MLLDRILKNTLTEDIAVHQFYILKKFRCPTRPIRLFMAVLKLKATVRYNIHSEDERCDPTESNADTFWSLDLTPGALRAFWNSWIPDLLQ